MKKQLLACIFTFFFTNLMLAQSINFTSSTLTTAEIGSTITVNYQYTSSVSGQIYCGINLLDDWTWVSLVATAQLNPAPAGTNVTGSFQLTIPAGTTPTANLTGALNYKINIELKNGSVWLAGDYPPNQINITPSSAAVPAISITSIPASTQVGTNLVVNYKYTAASAGKTSIAVTKNGGANPWDFISTVGYIELDPAVAGTDVTGTFTVPIPSTTTPTSALTGNENYRVVLELKNATGTWLAGDYSTVGYNFTAATVTPAISITSIPASTQVGTNLVVNYKYTAASAGKTSIAVTKNGGANPWDFISTVAYIELDPAVAGTDVTGTFTVPIPSTTTHTSALTGNENYRVVLELKNATSTWLAGDYSTVGYNFTESLNTNAFENSIISIYPNPTNDFIFVKGIENTPIDQVTVFDMLGKKVFASSQLNADKIDVSNLNSGIYMLTVSSDNSQKTIKFVKN
jgi:Secretion system C-terminal sorting domain